MRVYLVCGYTHGRGFDSAESQNLRFSLTCIKPSAVIRYAPSDVKISRRLCFANTTAKRLLRSPLIKCQVQRVQKNSRRLTTVGRSPVYSGIRVDARTLTFSCIKTRTIPGTTECNLHRVVEIPLSSPLSIILSLCRIRVCIRYNLVIAERDRRGDRGSTFADIVEKLSPRLDAYRPRLSRTGKSYRSASRGLSASIISLPYTLYSPVRVPFPRLEYTE